MHKVLCIKSFSLGQETLDRQAVDIFLTYVFAKASAKAL